MARFFVLLLQSVFLFVRCSTTEGPGVLNELACHEETEEHESSAGPVLRCAFRILKQDPTTGRPPKTIALQDCTSEVCVKAVVDVSAASAYQPPGSHRADDEREDVTSNSRASANINVESQTTLDSDTASFANNELDSEGVLNVGKAIYHKPYEQYGNDVAAVLEQAPSIFLNEKRNQKITNRFSVMEMTNFLLHLGNAHLELDETDPVFVEGMGLWYQLELSLNALKTGVEIVNDSNAARWMPSFQVDEYLGSLHYRIGEAYLSDPQVAHLDEALEHYEKARKVFEELRRTHPTDKLWQSKSYADACTKIGVTKLTQISNRDVKVGSMWAGGMDLGAAAKGVFNQEELVQMAKATMEGGETGYDVPIFVMGMQSKMLQELNEASTFFETALAAYKEYVDPKPTKEFMILTLPEKQDYYFSMATAAQQAATAATTAKRLVQAREYLKLALNVHVGYLLPSFSAAKSFSKDGREDFVDLSSKTSVGDLYLTLANVCLQLGDYPSAKKTYGQAMEWHDEHGIEVAPITSFEEIGMDGDGTLQAYLQELEEYRRMVAVGESGGSVGSSYTTRGIQEPKVDDDGGGMFYYERDNVYEGDVLAAIGALHLSNGNLVRSIDFLEQALALYENDVQSSKRSIADAKFNLAMAHFQARRFEKSKELHFAALDVYQGLYGDGVNPYLHDMEHLLAQAMEGDAYQMQSDEMDVTGGQKRHDSAPKVDLESFRASALNVTAYPADGEL